MLHVEPTSRNRVRRKRRDGNLDREQACGASGPEVEGILVLSQLPTLTFVLSVRRCECRVRVLRPLT